MTGVVMLVNEFWPLPVGGAETQAERLSAYLAAEKWDVWVVTRRAKGLPSKEERNGFQIIRPLTLGSGKIQTFFFLVSSLVTLYQLRNRYQILHAHLAFGPAFIAVLLGRFLGKKTIVKLGGSNAIGDIQVSLNTWRGKLRLAAIKRWANIVIVLTDIMQDEALQIGIPASRIKLMDNGIDANFYNFDHSTKKQAKKILDVENKVVVLFVGRLDPVKSLQTVIDGFQNAINHCESLKLFIVGDGPERASLTSRTHLLGLSSDIIFTGNCPDIKLYLQAADIFVLPSLTEGISNALLEAMASGLACVATPVGGNNEILEQGKYGIMPPIANPEAWASALVKLGHDQQERYKLGSLARERIIMRYDFNVVGNEYKRLYKELLDNRL